MLGSTILTNGTAVASGSTQATATETPTANAGQIVTVIVSAGSSISPTLTLTGCGLTWTLVKGSVFNGVSYMATFQAQGSPIAGALTIGGLTSGWYVTWIWRQITGVPASDRLEWPQFSYYWQLHGHPGVPKEEEIGDFGTAEQGIYARPGYLWESCQTSTWRLWGYTRGERWKSAEEILDLLVECAAQEGNLLLNVGPQPDGRFPPEFVERARRVGQWLAVHGEAIYDCERGNVVEFVTRGWQTTRGNNLYLILRFHDGRPELRLADLASRVKRVTLLTTGQTLPFTQKGQELFIRGLPALPPSTLFPVIKVECAGRPRGGAWARSRVWGETPETFAAWARKRGTSVWRDGKER